MSVSSSARGSDDPGRPHATPDRGRPIARLRTWAVSALCMGAIFVAVVLVAARSAAPSQAADAVDWTACDAVRASRELFPTGRSEAAPVVLRTDLGTVVRDWYGGGAMDDWDGSEAVWVVGLLGDGLRRYEVVEPPPLDLFVEAMQKGELGPPADGGYFVWGARSHDLIARGVLNPVAPEEWFTAGRLATLGTPLPWDATGTRLAGQACRPGPADADEAVDAARARDGGTDADASSARP